jgi:hypothetical protein
MIMKKIAVPLEKGDSVLVFDEKNNYVGKCYYILVMMMTG